MKTVVLCGGLGTRLREETEYRPKPMVEIGGRPILWHIMKNFAHFGQRDFVLCLGFRGNTIKEYFLNYEAMNSDFTIHLGQASSLTCHDLHAEQDFNVTLANTGPTTMTGGRILRIKRYVPDQTFMVTYGDGVSNLNIQELLKYHRSHGQLATVTTVRPQSRFGILNLDDEGKVTQFTEKPFLDGWASAGFFVFERQVFDYLDGDECVLEREPLERLAREGQLMAFRHDGFFFAMDTYREFQYLNELWSKGDVPWKVWN